MKQNILDAAVQIAARKGFASVTRIAVANKAGAAEGTVSYHFKSMSKLLDAVVKESIATEHIEVLAKALAEGNRIAKTAPQALKDRAAKLLTA